MFRTLCVCLCLVLLVSTQSISAHELRPGFIDLIEKTNNLIGVTWKSPIRSGIPLAVTPTFPKDCNTSQYAQNTISGNSVISTWNITCSNELQGQAINFPGLESTLTDIIVRYQSLDGKTQTLRAVPEKPFVIISRTPTAKGVSTTYLLLGIEHILSGIDHLLFVLALILLVRGNINLVKAISAFTIAHSITLAASILGHINLAPSPVESVIALSIVFLANELAASSRNLQNQSARLSQQRPWLITFSFGLLHGFGFAGALSEIGLPESEVPLALLMFNIGVELGQLAFLAVVLIVLAISVRMIERRKIEFVTSYIIGVTACFWLFQRTFI